MADTTEETRDEFSLRRTTGDHAVVLQVIGELDHGSASWLADELVKAGQDAQERPLVLDLSGISFIASAGIALLVEQYQRQRRQQTSNDFRIVVGESVVARALERTGLLEFLPVYGTLADALPGE